MSIAMTPFKAFKCYLALKAHFTTDKYDVVKYQGKINASLENFEKRNDRFRFEKLTKKMSDSDIINLFVANFVKVRGYCGLFDEKSEARYLDWKRYRQSLPYNFKNEVKALFEQARADLKTFDQIFFDEDTHPPVLVAYMGKEISIDTFVILDRLYNFVEKLDDNVVTHDILRLTKKYSPFVRVELDTYGNIAREIEGLVYGGT